MAYKLFRKYFVDLSLIFVSVIWALNFSIVKIALSEIDPFSFNVIRFTLSFLLLFSIAVKKGVSLKIKKEHIWPILGLGLLGSLIYQGFFIIGINLTNSSNAAVMLGSTPIWVALIAQFFTNEKLKLLTGIGIFFAFIGMVGIIIGGNEAVSISSDYFLGDIITLAAAIVWGVYTILSRKYLKIYSTMQYTTFMAFIGLISLSIIGVPYMLKMDWGQVSAAGYGGVLYSGLLSVGLAYLIWNNGVLKIGAVKTAAYQNLIPVLGLFFGVIILDEQLTLFQYIGSLLVIVGIILARSKK